MLIIDIEKRNLRTLRKFYRLEYYEQSSLDVQPDKKMKARNFSSEEAAKIVDFWQVPI